VLRRLTTASAEVRGDDRWYLRRITPYRTENDRVEGVVITFSDVTELKQAQTRERLLATVTRDSNDSILVLDFEGNILSINRGAERMYGWSEEEAKHRSLYDLAPKEERERMERVLTDIARNNASHYFETRRLNRNGERIDVGVTASVLWGDSGEANAVAMTERDVTDIRRSQARLADLNRTLEQRVSERTAEAQRSSRQLRSLSLELLRTEERERQRLAELLHDDLQQLLRAARMSFKRLRREIQSDAAMELADQIDQLLESSIESARAHSHELSPPILSGGGLIPALQWINRWMREHHGLTVELETAPEAEPNSEEIRFLLFSIAKELLFNVVKHAGVDEARLELRRERDGVMLGVSDAGVGYEGDPLKPSEEPVSSSAGFGLVRIRERIHSMGGTIQFESVVGQGFAIAITLPDPPGDRPQAESE